MRYSDEELRAELRARPWTAYNIPLSEGVSTLPGTPSFFEDARVLAITRTLRAFFGSDLGSVRIADLGCLEGGFSIALALAGAQVVGFDAREENLRRARFAAAHFELDTLEFRQLDVKGLRADREGRFDVVLVLGLLYHLDRPVEWLAQIAPMASRLLVVDTHVAPPDDAALARLHESIARVGGLERITVAGTAYSGRWFREVEPGATIEDARWAAWSNRYSFWLTRESLCLAIQRAGCDLVYEQQDWMLDQWERCNVELARRLVVGVKSAPGLAVGAVAEPHVDDLLRHGAEPADTRGVLSYAPSLRSRVNGAVSRLKAAGRRLARRRRAER